MNNNCAANSPNFIHNFFNKHTSATFFQQIYKTVVLATTIVCSHSFAQPLVVVQAENYSNMRGIQTEPTKDTGGGLNVGWIDVGDWLSYTNTPVVIPQSGRYIVELRVASPNGGGAVSFEEAGANPVYSIINIPRTGGWQNWTSVKVPVTLSAGTHRFGLNAKIAGWNINWFSITADPQDILVKDIPFADTAFANCVNTMATTYGWTLAKDVQSLECYGQGIVNLSGIEYLTGLTKVRLGHNAIVKADFNKNSKLTWISLEHNRTINFIDVSSATQLTTLDLWENSLTTINLNNNPVLNWLSIGENPLTPETKAYIRSLPQITSLQIDP